MDAERFRDEQRALRELVGRRRRGAGDGERPVAPPDAGAGAPPDADAGAPIEGGPFVSVIVVCWNAAEVLGRCLEQLLAQDYSNREIVVVDDGSSDGSFEVAERASARAPLTLVRSGRNRGCPAARNLGLRHAGGEIVAFIDADGFADRRWLSRVVAAFGEDETIGGIASTVFYDDNPIVLNGAGGTVNRQGWAADLSMNESFEFAELAGEALYPMGCGMAVRRAALERVGEFDDRMLNYYDDVDYGVRLWRAGYRVRVAADAWIDHAAGGVGAAGGDSPRKRLWCERHRMRVVLKHAPARLLGRWAAEELRALRAAPGPVRVQKLRSIAWNVRRLPSALGSRRRLRAAPPAPGRLIDGSWGDGFPVGVPPRPTPVPRRVGAGIEMRDARSSGQLVFGWYPPEAAGERSRRWAGPHAAALIRLEGRACRLSIDYAHVPVDVGGIDMSLRRLGAGAPGKRVWATQLHWSYAERVIENHPVGLAPGDYEVRFDAKRSWSDPPRETRTLAFALSALTLCRAFTFDAEGRVRMEDAGVERQLVRGWYEGEQSAGRHYRWGGRTAEAVIRVVDRARTARVAYRMPPADTGPLRITAVPFAGGEPLFSELLQAADDWCETTFAVDLPPGCYVVALEAARTWSNPDGRIAGAAPEARALGFALASIELERDAAAAAR